MATNKQTDRTTAIYYRVARKQTDSLFLDNQMQTLLCYANEKGLDSYTLYDDVGRSGATLDCPAFNALIADIEAERISAVIIHGVPRIARNFILTDKFIELAQARSVAVISITDSELTAPPCSEFVGLFRSLLKGGVRA